MFCLAYSNQCVVSLVYYYRFCGYFEFDFICIFSEFHFILNLYLNFTVVIFLQLMYSVNVLFHGHVFLYLFFFLN